LSDLYRLSLIELLSRTRGGSVTAVEAVRSCLARSAALDAAVHAWQHFAPESALERAEALDAGVSGGQTAGVLHGSSIGVKDIIDVAGMPTTYGSAIYADHVPSGTAACVAALERAGAIVPGKTVSTEFAYYTPGKTKNPWNVSHTPGGSSMGSAAGVACGMVTGAIGTQTNGSVIRPAAYCGIVGYKPSFGAIANHGTLDPWPTIDQTGVFARSVADAALLAAVISMPERKAHATVMPFKGSPRLAVVRSPVWHLAAPEQKDLVAANAATLRHAGGNVFEAELPPEFMEAHRVHRAILAYEGARHFRELQARERARISPQLNALLDEGAAMEVQHYDTAVSDMLRLQQAFAAWMGNYDAVLTPPATGEAPGTLLETGSPAFCTIWSLLGVPALTLPTGLGPHGLPLGLQVVGARDDDARLLSVAAWCEARLPFVNRVLLH
jgi:Asp-tRNA(Asn)/Glu-tRNA(Gln) amidotransferase A subunit family amidase